MSPADASEKSTDLKLDQILGKAAKPKPKDRPIYLCPGKTHQNEKYTYLAITADCGIEGYKPKIAFYVPTTLESAILMPLASCETPAGNRYATLSAQCENTADQVIELLGYITANRIEDN